MKAIVYDRYGPPDVLRLVEVEKPVAAPGQVLVRVHGAAVNPYDWHFMRGKPYFLRLVSGLRAPKRDRLGVDFAGVVEAVGPEVTTVKVGDEVYGMQTGAFAQYLCAPESSVAPKPRMLDFSLAAAIPLAGLTALQGLRNSARLQAGERVLIIGASGGVGTFAVQIAKHLGARVTGVCSTGNLDGVKARHYAIKGKGDMKDAELWLDDQGRVVQIVGTVEGDQVTIGLSNFGEKVTIKPPKKFQDMSSLGG